MRTTGNTILITGGGTGIGRGLAEAFHALGNQVVIAGRREDVLQGVVAANPGMALLTGDMSDAAGIASFARRAVEAHPALDVLIANAGIMVPEALAEAPSHLDAAERTIDTNLLGPIRLIAALLPHFRARPRSAILTVSSGLAFVPLAMTPTYCATKAAIHSYSSSLRHQLAGTATEVIEIIPPYVQTELTGAHQASDPRAMPLDAYISEVMDILTTRPAVEEVVVERCKPQRFAAESGKTTEVFQMVNAPRPR